MNWTMMLKIKVNMNIKNSIIYFEENVVRVALDLEYI